jgi:hypothetical protein
MYTYFIVASEDEIAKMRSLDDALSHLARIEPLVGGKIDLQALSSLSNIFLQVNRASTKQTHNALLDGSIFYLFDQELCKKIAAAEHEQLLDASVAWDEESWRGAGVNRMDLAGFLLDLSALCREVEARNAGLYALVSNEV